jgi:hypothetical protein
MLEGTIPANNFDYTVAKCSELTTGFTDNNQFLDSHLLKNSLFMIDCDCQNLVSEINFKRIPFHSFWNFGK